MSDPSAPLQPDDDDALIVATDDPIELSRTPIEGWLALGTFWLLGATVAWQFFTRYVLGSSASWTEEIARYLLVATVFVGASLGVIKNDHIQVDFLYRHLPPSIGRRLSLGVDVLRVAFFACMVVLVAQMMVQIGSDEMTVVSLPMNTLYAVVELALCAMTWRSARLAWDHYHSGWTPQAASAAASAAPTPGGAAASSDRA